MLPVRTGGQRIILYDSSIVGGRNVDRLAEGGYQVIRFDHRDTGRSTTNPPGDIRYGLLDLANDPIAILDAYGVPTAHLVGMSLGGYLAQIAALQRPERVQTLTLIASEPLGIPYQGEGIAPELMEHFSTMADLDWSDRDAVARFMLRISELSAGSAVPFDRDTEMNRIERELQRTTNMQSAFNHALIDSELDAGMTARALHLPVLVIHGSEDPIISSAAAQSTVEAVAGSELMILKGRGHELLEQDVPRIAGAILRLAS